MNDSDAEFEFNVRADFYGVARTTAPCDRCSARIVLLALWVPDGHATLDEEGHWNTMPEGGFVFDVTRLSAEVVSVMVGESLGYRQTEASDHGPRAWANHCMHCGAAQADEPLYCEPEAPFAPLTEAAAARLDVRIVEQPFRAIAGGFSSGV